jgi:hypothetical protein
MYQVIHARIEYLPNLYLTLFFLLSRYTLRQAIDKTYSKSPICSLRPEWRGSQIIHCDRTHKLINDAVFILNICFIINTITKADWWSVHFKITIWVWRHHIIEHILVQIKSISSNFKVYFYSEYKVPTLSKSSLMEIYKCWQYLTITLLKFMNVEWKCIEKFILPIHFIEYSKLLHFCVGGTDLNYLKHNTLMKLQAGIVLFKTILCTLLPLTQNTCCSFIQSINKTVWMEAKF